MRRVTTTFVILILLISVLSCSPQNEPILVVTDIPEVIDYLEFIRSQGEWSAFTVQFVDQPDRITALGGIAPDIIISSSIAHREFQDYLHPIPLYSLQGMRKTVRDDFSLSDLYEASYRPFLSNNALKTIPLAFDLPVLMYNDDATQLFNDRDLITYRELLAISDELNVFRGDNFSTMGFSSLRDIRFLELLLRQFSDVRGSLPPEDIFVEALGSVEDLLALYQQNSSAQFYFNEIFAYSPDRSDMAHGRLYSAMAYFSDRAAETFEAQDDYPFMWLESDEGLEVLTPGIYTGLLKSSRKKSASIAFIRLMLSARTQRDFLESLRDKNINTFLNRLSSNRILNEYSIPVLNPGFSFPEEDRLFFPGIPDPLWDDLRDAVISPWLADYFAEESVDVETLYESVDHFYRLNMGYN